MKGENPDGYYKPLSFATALGMRSGKLHFWVGQDLPNLLAVMSTLAASP